MIAWHYTTGLKLPLICESGLLRPPDVIMAPEWERRPVLWFSTILRTSSPESVLRSTRVWATAKYAGRKTIVHGIVEEVRQVGDTTYVSFGQEYPFQTFSAVISPEHYSKVFRSIPVADEEGGFGEYWVTGRVEIVDGRAIVRITKQNQIVSDAHLPQDD